MFKLINKIKHFSLIEFIIGFIILGFVVTVVCHNIQPSPDKGFPFMAGTWTSEIATSRICQVRYSFGNRQIYEFIRIRDESLEGFHVCMCVYTHTDALYRRSERDRFGTGVPSFFPDALP